MFEWEGFVVVDVKAQTACKAKEVEKQAAYVL